MNNKAAAFCSNSTAPHLTDHRSLITKPRSVSSQTEILKTKMSHNHQNISTLTEQTGSKNKPMLLLEKC